MSLSVKLRNGARDVCEKQYIFLFVLQCSTLEINFERIRDPVIVGDNYRRLQAIPRGEEMPSWEKRHVLNQSAAFIENKVYEQFGT